MCVCVHGIGRGHFSKTKNFVVRIFKWLLRSSESSEPPLNDVSAFSLFLAILFDQISTFMASIYYLDHIYLVDWASSIYFNATENEINSI